MQMTERSTVFKISNLTYLKDGKTILDNISFEIGVSEKVVLLGLNGSGKTTLLKILNALYFASGGNFSFDGQIVAKKSFNKLFEKDFRQKCVLLFQNYEAMFFCKSIYEDIAFSPTRFGLSNIDAKVVRAANMFGLKERLDEFALAISGGEKQRAALACLFALEPSAFLLDEPTSALDPFWSARLVELLDALGACVISATHNLSLACELGARAIVLKDGRVVFDGKTEEFLNDKEAMLKAGLLHSHKHAHEDETHEHLHAHDWN